MIRQQQGIIWIGASILALIGTIDYFIPELHLTMPSALIGFAIGITIGYDIK